ncbi:MAG: hypothetical protein EX270_04555, partial [Pseudomonadales bacterium]
RDLTGDLEGPRARLMREGAGLVQGHRPQQPGGRARNYGLGLSFVHSVIERHGGQIDVQSSIGKGTCITLYLPKTELD